MRKSSVLVQGIGYKGMKYPCSSNCKQLKEYTLWLGVLSRCHHVYYNKHPTYTECTVSEAFKSYEYFYEWCNRQVGFGNIDENGKSWCLDKDILVKGNKVYSEDTCVFIPQRVNKLLTKRDSCRGEYPVGVFYHKRERKFRAQCSDGTGLQKQIGSYDTPQEAFTAYKEFKENIIKKIACENKLILDSRVYDALINYKVNEND